ncbi:MULTISPECIES: ABC transporter permease [Sutcliffiella]|uniref:Transport permease protein n=1 Tax=Sutcliffiella cohnii TaxID=33932 RepID=A0A223KV82_9BACI|nr:MULTISPECIES: ABC transporter permease [Sutcliffiella]AST93379.1 teichoic acid ABC transporter permease [Sutcliffiella cohnii]WBL14544.1 ABC transporter permease [Sutcliffiella sp. NC1]
MRKYLLEMLKRKDLLLYLVKSGLKAENRNSYLGYFWWLLDPLLNVLVYYFLVVIILERGGENYAVYLVIGLVVWRWMNTTVTTSAKAIRKYGSIINQVYLPKSIFPLATTSTQLFNFAFGLIVVAIFLVIFGIFPSWHIVYLPVIVLVQLVLLLAIALFLAYICVFIRDIDNILSHIMRLFFYASPIIWEGSRLPEKYDWVVAINPVAIIVDSYRSVLMYNQNPAFLGLFVIGFTSIICIAAMIYFYSKNEHKIIKAL